VWKEKIDDYQAGYSNTAAPIIAKGLLLTGVSGGEFGVIGRVEARDPKTGKMVWVASDRRRPHGLQVRRRRQQDRERHQRHDQRNLAGRPVEGRRRSHLAGRHVRLEDRSGLLRHRQPGTVEQPPAPRRQPVLVLDDGDRHQDRPDQVALPGHAERRLGLRRHERIRHLRHERQAHGRQGRPQRLLLRAGCQHRQVRARLPVREQDHWAKGLDAERQADLRPANRPGDPTKGADGKKGESVFSAPSFLGGKNQMPMAYSPDTGLFYVPSNEWGMEIWNEPITYKKGAAYLGAGFTIKTLDDKYIGGDYIGAMRAVDPKTGKIVWEVTQQRSAVGWCDDDQGRPGVLGHARRLS
jgi:alcohol dehydrogenase (cytochrome c)